MIVALIYAATAAADDTTWPHVIEEPLDNLRMLAEQLRTTGSSSLFPQRRATMHDRVDSRRDQPPDLYQVIALAQGSNYDGVARILPADSINHLDSTIWQAGTECLARLIIVPSAKKIAMSFRYSQGKDQLLAQAVGHSKKELWSTDSPDATVMGFYSDAYKKFLDDGLKKEFYALMDDSAYADYQFYVTGTSLGAGLATVAFADLAHDVSAGIRDFDELRDRVSLYTFGSPRVGGKSFHAWWFDNVESTPWGPLGHKVYRVTYDRDLVPLLPPQWVPLTGEDFLHVGQEYHYSATSDSTMCAFRKCENELFSEDPNCSSCYEDCKEYTYTPYDHYQYQCILGRGGICGRGAPSGWPDVIDAATEGGTRCGWGFFKNSLHYQAMKLKCNHNVLWNGKFRCDV